MRAARNARRAPVRAVAAVLLVLYAVIIARLTLFPAQSETSTFGVLDDVVTRLTNGGLTWTQIEALANVALFVPAGFLLALVVRRSWVAVVGCALASASIEWAQFAYLPSRVPSLADVEHNSLGGLVGALVAWPLVRLLRRPTDDPAASGQAVMPARTPSRVR